LEKSSSRVTVRKGANSDIPRVIELWREFITFHADRDPVLTPSSDAAKHFNSWVQKHLVHKDKKLFVALSDEEPIGFCLAQVTERSAVFKSRRIGVISDLAVTAPWRRQGVGSLLLKAALKWLHDQSLGQIDVNISVHNEVALSFWQKYGFKKYLETWRLDT
jgi:GNAT superfamily N-acetyltransferase